MRYLGLYIFIFTATLLSALYQNKSYAYLATDYVELKVTFKKDNGQSCSIGTDCISGNCVDNYCCNTSCSGDCESCALSGTEGTCTTRSSGDNTECTTCNYCDGSNTTCQLVDQDTDPYDDCDVSCSNTCTVYTGFCDGGGSCDTSLCSAGTACLSGTCDSANYCNEDLAYCSCAGDDCYDDSGDAYACSAQCDGGGNCDYASNCVSTATTTRLFFDGNFSLNNFNFDYFGPTGVSLQIIPNPIPDTGMTLCYDNSTTITCSDANFPSQDADFDINPPSYTAGTYTVIDDNTSFEWQRYGHGSSDGYTVPTSSGDCGTNGSYFSSYCRYYWADALTYCSDLSLDGHSDWRLPNAKELITLINFASSNPMIDTTNFLYTSSGIGTANYWTSTTFPGGNTRAFEVRFDTGNMIADITNPKSSTYKYVRCIRGTVDNYPDTGQTTCYDNTTSISCANASYPDQDGDYTINAPSYDVGTDTVLDNNTGLEWQRDGHGSSDGVTTPTSVGDCSTNGDYSLSYCRYYWQDALKYCDNMTLDSHSDWRLPSIKELASISDYSTDGPSIDTSSFISTRSSDYWTSTTRYANTAEARTYDFDKMNVRSNTKNAIYYYVRCVRGE